MSKQSADHSLRSSTQAKDLLRHEIDRNLIRRFQREYYPDQKLAYIGLPGHQLLDILSWREFLDFCTAVEDANVKEALELNVMRNRLEQMIHVVYADINELLSTPAGQDRLRWPYQIVNLDYAGGLIHLRDDRTSSKLEAIKGLIMRQGNVPFLLFLTINLRDKDKGELSELVRQREEEFRLLRFEGVKRCFDNHRAQGNAGLLKLYVPIFLLNEAIRYELNFLPPILYRGTRQMIHFAVEFKPYAKLGAGRILSTSELARETNKSLIVCDSGDELREVSLGGIELVNDNM